MYTLLLTLGHNSSALIVNSTTRTIIGYEEERLTGKKSDSSFPLNSIQELGQHIDLLKVDRYFVSHWFDYFDAEYKNKYWDPDALKQLCPNARRVVPYGSQSEPFFSGPKDEIRTAFPLTHHDAHAYSALAFTENYINMSIHKWHTLVIDGFGNNQEVISVYELDEDGNEQQLLHRVYGYRNSMGLMFQYAADACGMDGINDVYKFLGYRAALSSSDPVLPELEAAIEECVKWCLVGMFSEQNIQPPQHRELINKADLHATRAFWIRYFDCDLFNPDTSTRAERRSRVGYFVQGVLEKVVLYLIRRFNISNLMVAGGCFYNVRLNGQILKYVDRLSVNPLAGDQGGAIGLYRRARGRWSIRISDLNWGVRRKSDVPIPLPTGFHVHAKFEEHLEEIAELLKADVIVNIVRPGMEFGPRALCRTSTLALPTMKNVETINGFNLRNTIMPMAPVMTYGASRQLFKRNDLVKVIGTDQYMVCAHELAKSGDTILGATLNDFGRLTARPQIISDQDRGMLDLLDMVRIKTDCLINTSFNDHGQPIVFTLEQALDLHRTWTIRNNRRAFVTYYFTGK